MKGRNDIRCDGWQPSSSSRQLIVQSIVDETLVTYSSTFGIQTRPSLLLVLLLLLDVRDFTIDALRDVDQRSFDVFVLIVELAREPFERLGMNLHLTDKLPDLVAHLPIPAPEILFFLAA